MAGWIYIGNKDRQRLYLIPEVPQPSLETTVPEVTHGFPPHYTQEFLNIIKRHPTTFHQGGPVRQITTVQHEIVLKDDTPFREAPRRYSDEKRKYIDAEVKELLAGAMIEATSSPFSSAITVARKKDGDYRFCIDYRRLNKQTIDASQCLPRIHEILKDIGTARIFSTFDLKSGYWQIPLSPESRKYTAFATPSGGQCQFRVMPFGLKNAPGTFQNFMRSVLADHWGKIAIAYLDDIIIFSSGWEEHLLHLSLILERLEIYGLTCAPKKCSFGQTSLQYLGHVVSAEGNCPQDRHLGAILSAEPPRTRRALRGLIGTMNWLGDYIPHYAHLISPMTDLLSVKKPYRWNALAQQSFDAIKEQFRKKLTLGRPDPDLPFILQTDTSAHGRSGPDAAGPQRTQTHHFIWQCKVLTRGESLPL